MVDIGEQLVTLWGATGSVAHGQFVAELEARALDVGLRVGCCVRLLEVGWLAGNGARSVGCGIVGYSYCSVLCDGLW
jgi:hypothetical protein